MLVTRSLLEHQATGESTEIGGLLSAISPKAMRQISKSCMGVVFAEKNHQPDTLICQSF